MSDNSTPLTGMTVNTDGTIDYDFEGHVSAKGVDLEETTLLAADSSIQWIDNRPGKPQVAQERIFGIRGAGPSHVIDLQALGELDKADLLVQGSDDTVFETVKAKVSASIGGQIDKVLVERGDEPGQLVSDFLQLAIRDDIQINFGVTLLNYSGGTVGLEGWPITNEVKVPHGLGGGMFPGGREPIAVIAVTEDRVWSVGVKAMTKTNFTLWAATGYYEIGEGDYLCYWIAIG